MDRWITAGVDGSPESSAAAAWAAREAVRRGYGLRLLHAWSPLPDVAASAPDAAAQADWARSVADEAGAAVASGHPQLPVSVESPSDAAVPALLGAAADAELLVLGSRGHGALVGFLVGSVGQQVIAESARPVVLVRADDRAEPEAAGREIVVGQEGAPEDSRAVLEFAFATASARGATLKVVRAWTLPPLYAYSPASLKLLDEAGGMEPYERKALGEALEPLRARYPDVPVVEHVEIGSAGQVLLASGAGAQLVVVGRRARRSAVGSRIGSVAHAVMHHAPCPVAVVPPA
ncbi:universal stress protein [Streptomyces sp. NPDC059262]|uniref:universal stress protein n=1 Tax=Streptomyces sp. NPDC059262 TaxID=3346797 RepID=UPI0036BBC305